MNKLTRCVLLAFAVTTTLHAQVTTQTLNYTGSAQTFTINAPCAVPVTITCYGASGANGASYVTGAVGGTGGLGSMASGVYTLPANSILTVNVGGQGSTNTGGFNGGGNGINNSGGGGGGSDVRFPTNSLSDRLIVAGGGGGGGNAGCSGATVNGGNGGDGASNGTSGTNSSAGAGGAAASGSVGGIYGIGCPLAQGTVGANGAAGVGGDGGGSPLICGARGSGGGGGGGYIGGGGGGGGTAGTTSCTLNDTGAGGGGAGGTNFFASGFTNTVISNGVQTGNGYVVISYPTSVAVPTISVSGAVSLCTGSSATLTASGATTYSWSTSQTSSSVAVSPTTTTTYTVTGTNSGCSNTAVATVTVDSSPTISVNSGTICSGTSFAIVPSGANTYTITGGSFNVSPVATTPYSVTGTGANGCVSQNAAVSTITVLASPTVAVNSGSICSGNAFTISPSGASTYTVSGGSFVVSPLSTTSYSVTGSSAAGCVSSNTAVSNVTVNTTPTLSVSQSTAAVCAGTAASFTASGANTYTWSTAATTSVISVSPSSTTSYSVRGTSAAGCISSSVTATLTINPQPVISATGGSICPAGVFTLTPAGATNYSFVAGGSTLTGVTATVSPLNTTNYTIIGLGSNGCISSGTNNATSTVVVLASPNITVTSTSASVCSGAGATLTASGANTYTWSTSTVGSTTAVNPLTQTIYTVTATGTNVCNGVRTFTLGVFITPTISVNSGTICTGYVFTMLPSGASTYTYSSGSNTVNPLVSSNYTVNGNSAQGCAAVAATSSVTVIASPTITANSGTVCSGGSFSIAPGGANTYTISSTTSTNVVNPLVNTNYTVTGTGLNGCVSPAIYAAVSSVTTVANPNVTAASSATAICLGQQQTTLTAGGATTYSWNTGSGNGTIVVSPVSTTVYTVTGISAVGCANTATVGVVVNALPVVLASASSNFVCVAGSSTLSASGAGTYSWSNGGTGAAIVVTPNASTNYTVTGVDALGCSNIATVAVAVNTNSLSGTPNSTVCSGSQFTLAANGAVTYTWNGFNLFQNFVITPTAAAVYTVVAHDANNCLLSRTVSVGVYALPPVTASPDRTLVCLGESATVTAGGASSYSWNNGQTGVSIVLSPTIDVLFAFTVIGTDNNNCQASATTTLLVSRCTGMESAVGNLADVSLYPNPNNGEFSIETSVATDVVVFNYVGQTLVSKKVGAGRERFDLSSQPSGVYFVNIRQGNTTKTVKVIKN